MRRLFFSKPNQTRIERIPDLSESAFIYNLIPDTALTEWQMDAPTNEIKAGYLFIGLGIYGLQAILSLKRRICQGCNGRIPENFQFLFIGKTADIQDLARLPIEEKIIIDCQSNVTTRAGVYDGFINYLEKNGQVFSNKVEDLFGVLNANNCKAEIVVVNSFAEPDSALIIPVSHWLRSIPILTGKIFRITLFSCLEAVKESPLNREGVFLQIREISRYTSGIQQQIDMPIPGVAKLATRFLIDDVVLSDRVDYELLNSAILAYFSVKSNSSQQDVEKSILDITKLNVFTLVFPKSKIHALLLKKFESYLLDLEPCYSSTEIRPKILSLLRSSNWNTNSIPFAIIANAYDRVLSDLKYYLPPLNIIQGFRMGIDQYLNEELAKKASFTFSDILYQKAFIKEFKQILDQAKRTLSTYTERSNAYLCVSEIIDAIPRMINELTHFENSLNEWNDAIVNWKNVSTQFDSTGCEDSDSIKEVLQFEDTYVEEFLSAKFVDNLLKRCRWEWEGRTRTHPELKWKYLPINTSGSMKDFPGVEADKSDGQLRQLMTDASLVINHYLSKKDILGELSELGKDLGEYRSTDLISTLQNTNPEPVELSEYILFDPGKSAAAGINRFYRNSEIKMQILNDPGSIIFGKKTDSCPIEDLKTTRFTLKGHPSGRQISLFSAETNAAQLEKEMGFNRNEQFGSQFVGLLGDMDLFELIIDTYFWGWIKRQQILDHTEYLLEVIEDVKCVLKNNNVFAVNLRDALYAAIVHMPVTCAETNHPFHSFNIDRTKKVIRDQCEVERRKQQEYRIRKQVIREKINELSNSRERFYRDLSNYLDFKYLH